MNSVFEGERVLILGGTGSLGQALIDELLAGTYGVPASVIVFSRDEAKHHALSLRYFNNHENKQIESKAKELLRFVLGDVRDTSSLRKVSSEATLTVYGAALKQVPSCESSPFQAVQTNVIGVENALESLRGTSVHTFVGVSTDKAVLPVSVMGFTKALQERIVIQSNLINPEVRSIAVRFANVLSSTGSVVPIFQDQLRRGVPLTITDKRMTRFIMSMNDAVRLVAEAIKDGLRGGLYIPKAPSAKILDLAAALNGGEIPKYIEIGSRPGEKLHELLYSQEEGLRTEETANVFRVFPELDRISKPGRDFKPVANSLSSESNPLQIQDLMEYLKSRGVSLAQTL